MPRLDLIRANTKKLVLSELLHKRRMPAFVQKVQTVFFADLSKRFGDLRVQDEDRRSLVSDGPGA